VQRDASVTRGGKEFTKNKEMRVMRKLVLRTCFALIGLTASSGLAFGQDFSFLRHNSVLDSLQSITESTIPANGDLNPYGVAFVPAGFPAGGSIAPGDVLVSNFNANSGLEGTGTTIISISPTGQQTLFATSKLIGLSTALGVLSRGFVIVGNLPVTYPNGMSTPGQGSLQVFDRNGNLVATFNDSTLLDSPWDLTIRDEGATAQVFVSNVLSGKVTRLNLAVSHSGVTLESETLIGSGFGHQIIPAIVAVGPTGLAYDPGRDLLYVASTADNEIFAIGNPVKRTTSAGTGFVVFADPAVLHGPLGLTLAPNGNLITANGDGVNVGGTQNELVEFTKEGMLVATYQLDGGLLGAAFGIASTSSHGAIRFAAVDDDLNTLTIWTLSSPF
jgi:DNA-binding beta-propeller fold protein YncE